MLLAILSNVQYKNTKRIYEDIKKYRDYINNPAESTEA